MTSFPAKRILVGGRPHDNPAFIHSQLDDYGLTPARFRVYAHIARRAGNRAAWPAISSMARICKLHPDTVRQALKFLVLHGLISREPRNGTTPLYRLNPTSQWVQLPNSKNIPRESNTPVSDKDAPPTSGMQGHPCETNGAKGSPAEGSPQKDYIHAVPETNNLPTSEEEAVEAAKQLAIPEDFARNEFNSRAAVGWVNGAGNPIRSWRHYLKKRWTDEQGQRAERATRAGGGRAGFRRRSTPTRQHANSNYEQPLTNF